MLSTAAQSAWKPSCVLCASVVILFVSDLLAREPAVFLQKFRTFHTLEEFQRATAGKVRLDRRLRIRTARNDLLIGSRHGIVLRKPDGGEEPFPADRLLPYSEVTVLIEQSPGILWIGTTHGAIRYDQTTAPAAVEYFSGKRWLPDDHVVAIGFENVRSSKVSHSPTLPLSYSPTPPLPHSPTPTLGVAAQAVWLQTTTGLSRIEFRPITLEQKARMFEERVRARHLRHGLVARSRLRVPGDLSSSQTASSDNDGLWTAMYLAAECFRFGVTGDGTAREYARQSISAMLRLESITGIPGFPARSFIKRGVEARPGDGEWHATADGEWEWKGDTSSDEIVGHYFAYPIYYDLCADESERAAIRAAVDRLTSHIVDHGFHLVDLDGKPTRWGWWAPEEIWSAADETGLRALQLLAHLKTAQHITGDARYKSVYDELISRHRYHLLSRNLKINVPGHVNHSDDELAFLSYYPLLMYETDPALRRTYLESLERSWRVERAEQNPLWDLIYAAAHAPPPGASGLERRRNSGAMPGLPDGFDLSVPVRSLQRIPMDLISWEVKNSHRLDLARDPNPDRFGHAQSLTALSPEERPMLKWNGNPYALDGGNGGHEEDDGAFFLLPYWLGRYHGLIP